MERTPNRKILNHNHIKLTLSSSWMYKCFHYGCDKFSSAPAQDTKWLMCHKGGRINQRQNHQLGMRLHLQLELTASISRTFQILTGVWTTTAAGGRAALLQLWRSNVSCGVYCRPTWAGAVLGGQWLPGQRPSCTGRRMPEYPSSGWVWPRASAGQGCCFWCLEQMVFTVVKTAKSCL